MKKYWRIDYWRLPSPSFVSSDYLSAVVAKIKAPGGHAAQDPWIPDWLWTFLPRETDYDPSNDIAEVLQKDRSLRILNRAEQTLQGQPRRSEESRCD
jgi:hypothetical protein